MGLADNLSPNLDALREILRFGKLFALQDWLKSGKPLRFPDQARTRFAPLTEAVCTGFHSIVEVLVSGGGWTSEELADALETANEKRRYDIAELLIQNGAKLRERDFYTLCQDMDLPMIERQLRDGADPNQNNAFADALHNERGRPLLGFYKEHRAKYPALDDQAALALRNAVRGKRVRWAALLVWAGADPFRHVPYEEDGTFPVNPDEEMVTSAAREAIWRDAELIKVLHLKPTPEQALELLDSAAYYNPALFRTLLTGIPRECMSDTDRNSCSALESLVSRSPDHGWSRAPTGKGDADALECIEKLLDAGARWSPSPTDVPRARRYLFRHDPKYIVQVLRLLLYTPGAADMPAFFELVRTQKLAALIDPIDRPLLEEIKALRRQLRVSASDEAAKTETAPSAPEFEHTQS